MSLCGERGLREQEQAGITLFKPPQNAGEGQTEASATLHEIASGYSVNMIHHAALGTQRGRLVRTQTHTDERSRD